jgi:hypothetical protein
VSFQKIFRRSLGSFLVISAAAVLPVIAQRASVTSNRRSMPVATGSNLYCAGYVQESPIETKNKIVGAVEEQERFNFTQGNLVYVNMGSSKGVNVGDMFAVVRPKGKVSSQWAKKNLGFFVQEVGALQVVSVKPDVSVARIRTSCESFAMGDLVEPIEKRVSPDYSLRPKMDLFGDPSGRATGRIVMARDSQEMVTRDQIVYLDLGKDDDVKVGDYVTVYRPLGKGHLFKTYESDSSVSNTSGFGSDTFKGGGFSSMSSRKKGETAGGSVETISGAKSDRPVLRKVVGEAMIVNVKERSATAVITRTAQEVHTGDFVELQ